MCNRTGHQHSIEQVEIDGLVVIRMADGTTIQTRRCLSIKLGPNGPQSTQFVSHLPVAEFTSEAEPYGMVDSEHPLIRQFAERVLDVIACPRDKRGDRCFDVPPIPDKARVHDAPEVQR